jgi:hypothetical protein
MNKTRSYWVAWVCFLSLILSYQVRAHAVYQPLARINTVQKQPMTDGIRYSASDILIKPASEAGYLTPDTGYRTPNTGERRGRYIAAGWASLVLTGFSAFFVLILAFLVTDVMLLGGADAGVIVIYLLLGIPLALLTIGAGLAAYLLFRRASFLKKKAKENRQ